MYYVYILKSDKDKRRYTGFTEDIERRLNNHNNGLVKSTRNRLPLKLIYKEEYSNKADALKREKFFKSGQGRQYIKEVLNL